jgi:cytochrome c biogenesis protein CcmG/thiol:disulfide interchange protein DsbE
MKKYFPFLLLALILGTVTGAFSSCGKFAHKSMAEDDDEPISGPLGPAPNVTFKSLDGSEISLESLRGKVVLVNFWATWCEPCKIETPWMIEFQKKYGDKGFTILGVAMDDEGASVVGPFVAKEKFDVDGQSLPIPYPVVLGNDDLGTKFGGIMGLPTSFIITRDGKIATRVVGVVSRSHLEKAIQHSL